MNPSDGSRLDARVRGTWLVRYSVLFAVCLEVVPIEADALSVLCSIGAVGLALVMKAAFLTLIFLPLVIYVALNGLSALKCVWGRVTIVVVIVTINLALDFLIL